MVPVIKITREELKGMMDRSEKFVLIDARNPKAYAEEHLPGAVSHPSEKLAPSVIEEIDKEETVVTYCSSFTCEASTIAATKLEKFGYRKVLQFKGGLADWKAAGYPTEKK